MNIKVTAQPKYIAAESDPSKSRFFFSYTICIENLSPETVQLISRHWVITDANQQVQEVRGEGVVGQQPLIDPGETYEYTSGVMLETPVGTMEGSYQMMDEKENSFDTAIPQFTLANPKALH